MVKIHKILDTTRLRRNPKMVFSEIDGEVVMLSVENGEYYNLNISSSEIWTQLNETCTFKELIMYLHNNYDVSQEECENDTRTFIDQGIEKGIIEIIYE